MDGKDFFNYETELGSEKKITTHLINVAAAISRFSGLRDKVIEAFSNDDEDIKDEYNKIKIDDSELREQLTRSIMYGEKYNNQLFMDIIEEYVLNENFHKIVYENAKRTGDGQGYAVACALLDDYFCYLESGEWCGLSTTL